MYKFTEDEKESVKTWDKNQKEKILIKFVKTASDKDEIIEEFLFTLSELTSNLIIQNEQKTGHRLPEIIVTDNIKYSAVPLSHELPLFLKALSFNTSAFTNAKKPFEFSQSTNKILEKITTPVKLTLYAAPGCPNCPKVVEDMLGFAFFCKNIDLTIIDPMIFSNQAEENSISSVPCLVLDDDFRWTGSVSQEEVADVLANRDLSTLKASSLRRILEDGKASLIAGQMIEKDMIFPEFIKLILHEIWSVRLGAMVVVEELSYNNIELAHKICPFLWENFSTAPLDVQGDILYAIGEAGSIKDIKLIEKECGVIDNADLKEAARDAIEDIKSRH